MRVPLAEDRRIFTPLARSSYKWERTYKKRTAVERVNARLDEAFGFKKHFIRGLQKNEAALCVSTNRDAGDSGGPNTGKTRNKYEEPAKGSLIQGTLKKTKN